MQAGNAVPTTAISAALIAALIGFGGTVALIVQAATVMGAVPAQVISAVTVLCLGTAVLGAALSIRFRIPVVLAWSTPGAALLGASTLGGNWPVAVGAFAIAGALMALLGAVPALGRLAARIPESIAAAMLAGVLLPFCLSLFRTMGSDAVLAGTLLLVFVIARQRAPLYAVLLVLAVAVAIVTGRGDVHGLGQGPLFGSLSLTVPEWDLKAMVGLALPLFLVTLVSQNLPGFVVLRSAGYVPPVRPLLLATGLATVALAPFGALSINLSAIIAAICTSNEAHPSAERRWIVGVLYGGMYLVLALFSAPLVGMFLAMPAGTIAVITGIALVGPLTAALGNMLREPQDREAAVLTFAATASGVALLGIGSAFWGLVTGFLVLGMRRLLARRAASSGTP